MGNLKGEVRMSAVNRRIGISLLPPCTANPDLVLPDNIANSFIAVVNPPFFACQIYMPNIIYALI